MTKYSLGQRYVDAVYTEVQHPMHQGNPLIEALPENKGRTVLAEELKRMVVHSEEQLQDAPEDRMMYVDSLRHYFAPWELHIELAQEIYRTICDGYVNRNPVAAAFPESIRQIRESVQKKDSTFCSCTFSTNNPISSSFAIIGYSGMGKSCSIRNIMNLIPQVIRHSEYKGTDFPCTQVVWMHIECPHDGSVKGLCQSFLEEFDRLVLGNTAHKYGMGTRATTNQMITQTAMLARKYHLGVLIIDEIQDISVAKGKTQQEIIQFLIQLLNSIQIPIVLIGTPPAVQVLRSDTKLSRRFPPKCYFDLLKEDQKEWKILCKSLWGYQWTQNRTQLTKELSHALYNASCGVTDAAVKMVVAAQQKAISQGGDELVTPELIYELADSFQFRIFRERIKSIQNRDIAAEMSGDCATLGWNRFREQFDVKQTLPLVPVMRNPNDPLDSEKKESRNEQRAPAPKRKRKKAAGQEDGYQSMLEAGLIADLEKDLFG